MTTPELRFDGRDLLTMSARERRQLFGRSDRALPLSVARGEAWGHRLPAGHGRGRVALEGLEVGRLGDAPPQRRAALVSPVQHRSARVAERRETAFEGDEQLQVVDRREVEVLEQVEDHLVPRRGETARV